LYLRNFSPYCRTISPLLGAGINLHVLKADVAISITFSYSSFVVVVTQPIRLPSTGENESIFFPLPKERDPTEVPLFKSFRPKVLRAFFILCVRY